MCKVYLSKDDYSKIFNHYKVKTGTSVGKINYQRITDDIGANSHSIKLIQRSKKYLSQIKQLRASSEQKSWG